MTFCNVDRIGYNEGNTVPTRLINSLDLDQSTAIDDGSLGSCRVQSGRFDRVCNNINMCMCIGGQSDPVDDDAIINMSRVFRSCKNDEIYYSNFQPNIRRIKYNLIIKLFTRMDGKS